MTHDMSVFSSAITVLSSAMGGAIGGFGCFPFEGIKKRLQRKEISRTDFYNLNNGRVIRILHPYLLFQGSSSFATSVAIASLVSITVNKMLKTLPSYDPASFAWNLKAAALSGAFGSLLGSTPVENTILVQQQKNVGPLRAIHYMLQQGILRPWVGASELLWRESGFGMAMLCLGPMAHQSVKKTTNDEKLALLAELAAGAFTSLLTHPADTIATYRQKLEGKVSIPTAVKALWAENGLTSFYKGGGFRIWLVTGCAMIIPRAQSQAEAILKTAFQRE